MTDTYKEAIRNIAVALCDGLGRQYTAKYDIGFSKHRDQFELIISEGLTHPHSPYECYWRDRALAAEKRLQQATPARREDVGSWHQFV